MRPFVRRTLQVAVMAGGFGLLGVGVAHADDATSGPSPTASSGAVHASASACDNHVPVAGSTECVTVPSGGTQTSETESSKSRQTASSSAEETAEPSPTALSSGNQINPVVNAPITVCGNTVAVLAEAQSECAPRDQGGPSGSPDNTTSGDEGVLSGNQINPVVDAPITVCGNAVAVAGEAGARCGNGGATPPGKPGKPEQPAKPTKPEQPDDSGEAGDSDQPGGPDAAGPADGLADTGASGPELELGLVGLLLVLFGVAMLRFSRLRIRGSA